MLKKRNIRLIYSVPYCPKFNLIERVFSKVLIKLKNKNINKYYLKSYTELLSII